MRSIIVLFKFVVVFSSLTALAKEIEVRDFSEQKYKPTWRDLDNRILPRWYDDAKIGIFIHWGVYSVPSFGSEWFWINWKNNSTTILNFMKNNYPPDTTYQDFAPDFKAEFFDAHKWADLFKSSGARYVVLTSKHHEGFALWPSKRSFSWNSVDVGPKRDLVGELAKAVRTSGLKFGLYHSLFEWFNPMYVDDRATNFTHRQFVDQKVWPDIQQLINDYQPSVLWSDGEWEAKDEYWRATELLAWLYNDSPVKNEIVVNDRWGIGSLCRHGGFYTCTDRYNPGILQPHKWENAMTIDKRSWGYRRNADIDEYKTVEELLRDISTTISCGGNILMNVGPTKEGTISPIFQDRLLAVGKWLSINGEAIYSSSPWQHQNDTFNGQDIWYTCRRSNYDVKNPTAPPDIADVDYVYAIVLKWPQSNVLTLKDVSSLVEHWKKIKVELLGNSEEITWKIRDDGSIGVILPDKAIVASELAWVLKFSPLKSLQKFHNKNVIV